MFEPIFHINNKIARALMAIEADRQIVARLPLTKPMLDSLRKTARLLFTHFSTQIEGNRLTRAQVQAVVEGEGNFPGRERDEAEVRHYFAALEQTERLGRTKAPLTEKEIRTIHGLVMNGKPRATPYRDGQNVIRDARTGRIVYMPPEAQDVAAMPLPARSPTRLRADMSQSQKNRPLGADCTERPQWAKARRTGLEPLTNRKASTLQESSYAPCM